MRAFLSLTCLLVLSACGCSPTESAPQPGGHPGNQPSDQMSHETPSARYEGPELTASVEIQESHPPQYTLVVEVNCPTGGYALTLSSYDGESTPRVVSYVLTSPASDELVIQAFQKHSARIDLGADRTPVQVRVCQRQRRDPDGAKQPFKLAATVAPQ